MVFGFVASVQGKEIASKIVVAKVRNLQRMNDPLVHIWIIAKKCPSQQSSGKISILETVDSETTNWYTRSCNGAFSLSFIGTIMNS